VTLVTFLGSGGFDQEQMTFYTRVFGFEDKKNTGDGTGHILCIGCAYYVVTLVTFLGSCAFDQEQTKVSTAFF
jgi:hypothetical protein